MDNEVNIRLYSHPESKKETWSKPKLSWILPAKEANLRKRNAADYCEVHLSSYLISNTIIFFKINLGLCLNHYLDNKAKSIQGRLKIKGYLEQNEIVLYLFCIKLFWHLILSNFLNNRKVINNVSGYPCGWGKFTL